VVLTQRAAHPTAVFSQPPVLHARLIVPTAVLPLAVVVLRREQNPIAVLKQPPPVRKALLPIAVLPKVVVTQPYTAPGIVGVAQLPPRTVVQHRALDPFDARI
jgi:hypothetical protein